MKDKLKKCKRPHIDWQMVIHDIGDHELSCAYIKFCSRHRRMSMNRCAWNVLKSYYSTTALKNYRDFGIPLLAPDVEEVL